MTAAERERELDAMRRELVGEVAQRFGLRDGATVLFWRESDVAGIRAVIRRIRALDSVRAEVSELAAGCARSRGAQVTAPPPPDLAAIRARLEAMRAAPWCPPPIHEAEADFIAHAPADLAALLAAAEDGAARLERAQKHVRWLREAILGADRLAIRVAESVVGLRRTDWEHALAQARESLVALAASAGGDAQPTNAERAEALKPLFERWRAEGDDEGPDAIPALRAYAKACAEEMPDLAADLRKIVAAAGAACPVDPGSEAACLMEEP